MQLKQSKKLRPDCDNCDRPSLLPSNSIVVNIYNRYRNVIVGETINLLAIDKVMDYEDIPMNRRALFVRKIVLYSTILVNKSYERTKDGKS